MPSKKGRRGRRSSARAPENVSPPAPEQTPSAAPEVDSAGPSVPGPLDRADAIAVAGVAAGAALLFLSTFSTQVALGDAPESVAGVRDVGILHAPGYPAYVLAAHAFATVVPIGSWALRVNLFSLVCATLMVAGVYLLARGFGAGLAGAALGSLSLASTASFWFNADFAKHYAFSGLLVTASALAVVWWQRTQRGWLLVIAAALLGVGSGASWEAAVIMAVGLVLFVAFSPRRPHLVSIAAAVVIGGGAVVGVWAFVIARAKRAPAVNWGDATNLHRVLDLISQKDFSGGVTVTNGGALLGRGPLQALQYVGIILRDVGLGAFALAIVGAVVAYRTLPREKKIWLVTVAVLNLLAAAFVTGIERINGFLTGLIAGGYLLDILVVMVVLIGVGTTPVVDAVSHEVIKWRIPDRFQARRASALAPMRRRVLAAIVVVVLVPSLLTHFHSADHRMPPLADRYGHRVLAALPAHAVLFTIESDFSFPLLQRQVVHDERRDVTVVVIDQLQLQWYRELLTRQYHLGSTLAKQESITEIVNLVHKFAETRPVYFDTSTMRVLRSLIGYRADGLVAQVVSGKGPRTAPNLKAIADRLQADDIEDGLAGGKYFLFPNFSIYFIDERAHVELAKQFVLANDVASAEIEMQRAGSVDPIDRQIHLLSIYMKTHPDQAKNLILNF